uniref:Uncharacterized protein n=1 Tax=Glossina pallidipes TaxID=7398 RepID=A0A1B0AC80_GLOPL
MAAVAATKQRLQLEDSQLNLTILRKFVNLNLKSRNTGSMHRNVGAFGMRINFTFLSQSISCGFTDKEPRVEIFLQCSGATLDIIYKFKRLVLVNGVNTVTHARLVTSVEKFSALSGSVIENIALSISGSLQQVITKMSQANVYRFSNKDPRLIQLTQGMKSEDHAQRWVKNAAAAEYKIFTCYKTNFAMPSLDKKRTQATVIRNVKYFIAEDCWTSAKKPKPSRRQEAERVLCLF